MKQKNIYKNINGSLAYKKTTVEQAFRLIQNEEKDYYLENGIYAPVITLKLPDAYLMNRPKHREKFISDLVAYCSYNHRRYQIAYKVKEKYIEFIIIRAQEVGDAERYNIYIPRR